MLTKCPADPYNPYDTQGRCQSGSELLRKAKPCADLIKRNIAELIMAPTDVFWGERFARVRDPFGHQWGITTRQHDMAPAEIRAAAKRFDHTADSPRRP